MLGRNKFTARFYGDLLRIVYHVFSTGSKAFLSVIDVDIVRKTFVVGHGGYTVSLKGLGAV